MIFREVDGEKWEPIETLVVSVNDELAGTIIEMLSHRKGMMNTMNSVN